MDIIDKIHQCGEQDFEGDNALEMLFATNRLIFKLLAAGTPETVHHALIMAESIMTLEESYKTLKAAQEAQ